MMMTMIMTMTLMMVVMMTMAKTTTRMMMATSKMMTTSEGRHPGCFLKMRVWSPGPHKECLLGGLGGETEVLNSNEEPHMKWGPIKS